MRNEIRQVLQDYQKHFGKDIFAHPAEFSTKLPGASTEPIHILLNSAIGGMDAYSRLENSSSRNMATDVYNLTRELRKRYFIEERAAKITIECIAELLGYTPLVDLETAVQTVSPSPIGSIVKFGDYDWRVLELDAQNNKMLLLSENILEQRAYHPCYGRVTWENSMLRQYLNSEFINDFSAVDRSIILETKISNPDNLWYGTDGGNDTLDKIFVLNIEEADRYFGDSGDYLNKRRKEYAEGKWTADDDGWLLSNIHDGSRVAKHNGSASFWWLRSPGYSDCTVAYVSTPGNILLNGDRVCIGRGGVRPALWVKWHNNNNDKEA